MQSDPIDIVEHGFIPCWKFLAVPPKPKGTFYDSPRNYQMEYNRSIIVSKLNEQNTESIVLKKIGTIKTDNF
jgi:hypothetical protein